MQFLGGGAAVNSSAYTELAKYSNNNLVHNNMIIEIRQSREVHMIFNIN